MLLSHTILYLAHTGYLLRASALYLVVSNSNIGNQLLYILESNPQPVYGFRRPKNQMRITIACGLDSRSKAGFWKNDGATVHAVRHYNTIICYFIYYLL